MQVFKEEELFLDVLPLYKKVMSLPQGKDALKRLCIFCGICKSKKFYSLTRKSIKISGIICCDFCNNIFSNTNEISANKFKCTDHAPGSVFTGGIFLSSKCKACRLLQIMKRCELSEEKRNIFYESLSTECKKLWNDTDKEKTTASTSNGFIRLQYYDCQKWIDVSEKQIDDDSLIDVDSNSDHFSEAKDESDNSGTNTPSPEEQNEDSNSGYQYEGNGASLDIYDEEAIIDDPDPIKKESPTTKVPPSKQKPSDTSNFSTKSSERIRKKKKVDYIVGRKHKRCIYGPDGRILKNGRDLCDCLQDQCPGCHFPCPKCRSPKCGSECRINRRWYYDKVDIEGTNISWTNRWVPKYN